MVGARHHGALRGRPRSRGEAPRKLGDVHEGRHRRVVARQHKLREYARQRAQYALRAAVDASARVVTELVQGPGRNTVLELPKRE